MKALLISGIYPPDIGGPAQYIPKLERYLENRKWTVRVISLLEGKKALTTLKNGRFIGRQLSLPLRFVTTVFMIIVESKKTDCIFTNGLHQETAVASLFHKTNTVAKIVGDPVWERHRNKTKSAVGIIQFNKSLNLGISIKIQRRLLAWSLNRFDVVICPSRELCQLVRLWGVCTPTIYIPNGIEIEQFTNQKQQDYDIAVVGRLVKWKNVDSILKSCKNLNLRVAIVGDGPEREKLEQIAVETGCAVDFKGQVDADKVGQILNNSKVYVSLSSYEGMSFSLLQAMSLGMLVIVSDIDANTELVKHQVEGIVVSAEDESKLGDILLDAILNGECYSSLGVAAATKIRNNYSLQTNLASVESLLVGF